MSKENDSCLEREHFLKDTIKQYYQQKQNRAINIESIELLSLFSLTNEVYKVKVQDESLLFKIYHATLPQFTDTQLQTLIVTKLAEKNLYPRVLCYTSEFRIEQFVDSFEITQRSLSKKKLSFIMQKLAHFSCNYADFVKNYNKSHGTTNKFELSNMLKIFQNIYKQKKLQCPLLIEQCQSEIESVLHNNLIINKLLAILKETPTMLCHNDCHLGNILSSSKGEFVVDFQFCQFNYMGYDLGNFLNEWATQYGNVFEIRQNLEMQQKLKEQIMKIYFVQLKTVYKCVEQMEDWIYYTKLGRVLSHLFWMIIGLKQINDTRISFSMVYYVKRRKEEFLKHFNELLKLKNDF